MIVMVMALEKAPFLKSGYGKNDHIVVSEKNESGDNYQVKLLVKEVSLITEVGKEHMLFATDSAPDSDDDKGWEKVWQDAESIGYQFY